jgi:hypothetical protein
MVVQGGVSDQDVVLAVLGAAGTTAGFVLVFLGLSVSTIQSYDSEASDKVLFGDRVLGTLIGFAFLAGLAAVTTTMAWLAGDQGHAWYTASLVVFVAQLALLLLSALWVLWKFVWKDK